MSYVTFETQTKGYPDIQTKVRHPDKGHADIQTKVRHQVQTKVRHPDKDQTSRQRSIIHAKVKNPVTDKVETFRQRSNVRQRQDIQTEAKHTRK